MSASRLAVAAVAAAGLVLSGGAASAASKHVQDRSGDAAPVADITRVTVHNGEGVLVVKAKLAKASAGRTHLVATLTPTTEGAAAYVARTVALPGKGSGKGKRVGATLEVLGADGSAATPVECDGLRATVSAGRRGQSSIRVPQSCLGADAGTLVVDVVTATAAGEVVDEVTGSLRVQQG